MSRSATGDDGSGPEVDDSKPDPDEDHHETVDESHRESANEDHREHVDRSERVWDFWARFYEFNDRDTEPIRREAIETLDLEGGETVVDLGCGPGSNFAMLREAVGPEGRVLGVDVAPKMVRKAGRRIAENDWTNVDAIEADATQYPLADEGVDHAVATLALSAMPDVRGIVEAIYDALPPGGRLAVYDTRLVPEGPARALNPVIGLFYRYGANWNDEEDVLETLEAVFDAVEVMATHAAGTQYVVRAEKC